MTGNLMCIRGNGAVLGEIRLLRNLIDDSRDTVPIVDTFFTQKNVCVCVLSLAIFFSNCIVL